MDDTKQLYSHQAMHANKSISRPHSTYLPVQTQLVRRRDSGKSFTTFVTIEANHAGSTKPRDNKSGINIQDSTGNKVDVVRTKSDM